MDQTDNSQTPKPIEPSMPQVSIPKKSLLKPFILASIALTIFIVSLTTYMIMSQSSPIDTNKIPVSPTQAEETSTSPSITPQTSKNFILGGIKLPVNTGNDIKPVIKNKNIYYMKSGSVWIANVDKDNKVSRKLIFEGRGKILDYTISNDEKALAYTTRKLEYPLMDGPNSGDTVMLVDLTSKTEKEIFSQNLEGDQLNGILFSPDDRKLYFTNTKIHMYDLEKKNLNTYTSSAKPFSVLCSFNPDSFSPSGRYLLLGFYCWEGGSQIVFDTQSGETAGVFEVGYVYGGIGASGFLTDSVILGYNNYSESELEPKVWKMGVYSINGSLLKTIGEYKPDYSFQLIAYSDFSSSSEKAYISLAKELNSKEHVLYEIDRQTQTLSETNLKNDLLFTKVENPGENPTLMIQYYRTSNGIVIDIDRSVERQPILIR